jgi:transcription elongation GreA/GreB family factor
MAISRTIQHHLSKGDFDAVESEWLGQIDLNPTDIPYFAGVARALVGNGEEKRAKTLLEMLDEHLRHSHWAARLELLQRTGDILLPPEKLLPAVLATLGKIYGTRPTYHGLVEAVGLSRGVQEMPKVWEKVERLQSLLAFDVGTVVAMDGKGVGRVVDANLGLESFKVDFERNKGLMVGFKAAAKLLQPLSPEHVLRRKLEAPQELKKLSPQMLLQQVLTSYSKQLTAGEIRDIVAGIVAPEQWTSWWSTARKHAQVVASGTGARQSYAWAATSDQAERAVWISFEKANPRRKLELLRREGATREIELRTRMARALEEIANRESGSNPGLAFEIWFALERVGIPAAELENLPWSPERLLSKGDPIRVFTGIDDRLLRERGYAMVREQRPDWPNVFREAMTKETDARALDGLASALVTAGGKEFDRFVDQVLTQPHRQPAAFIWLAERAADDEELRKRNPLRLLQQILGAMSRDEFASYRTRLAPLADSGGTVPRLFDNLSEDQAPHAIEAVHRTAALEAYQRDQLTNGIELRFPSLRKQTEIPLYATAEAIDVKRGELDHIMRVEIPTNRKAIEEARAMGDLRENFEYKAARQRHEYLNSRAASLNADLSRVRPIVAADADLNEVRIGSRVRLSHGDRTRRITVLGPWESKPEDDVISYESDLGKLLLGRTVGSSVEIAGENWEVLAIEAH